MATLACREAFAAATRPHSMATLAGKEAIAAAIRPHSMATLAWREAIAAATRPPFLADICKFGLTKLAAGHGDWCCQKAAALFNPSGSTSTV